MTLEQSLKALALSDFRKTAMERRWRLLQEWAQQNGQEEILLVMKDLTQEPYDEILVSEVLAYARCGDHIEGIRTVRNFTGMSLRDAKDRYEAILRENGVQQRA